MKPLDCAGARDDIDAYAIGALDTEETRALEGHIAACATCARLVEEARAEATLALSLSAPAASSSPALKARVMASAAVLRELPVPRTRQARWWYAGAAGLVAAIASVSAWAIFTQVRVDRLDRRNAALRLDATAQSRELAAVRGDLQRAADLSAGLASTVATQNQIVDLMTEPDVRR
ncbi:MAG TPA: zf-HC2 domain-containing protein, partial [Steroidobacteraceae bacterium]|nr:zf-HC2 domain-containing protein [Steroidobacteraceae bacterium]